MRLFLQGEVPTDKHWREARKLFAHDDRTGIEIDAHTLTASEGFIYGIRLLALARHVCLYAEMLPGPGAPPGTLLDGPLPLGGEGRHVRVTSIATHDWPEATSEHGLWLLATPAPARKGWPDGLPPVDVCAAASEKPQAFSGWDVALNGPQPTRFAVPAGSVYFVNNSLPPGPGCLCSDAEQAAQGWGFALRGAWKP